eukprot:TRINITY_DN37837_c0_g1_i1.p1 TRINITY_DN37837_c0_g1~~TRINITY_DN37837_c0_g1_i1.p1  ORF type:complete len:432 (+),score=88.48 TRINITY_DN37837_c0_g1_i1:69-1364(+)
MGQGSKPVRSLLLIFGGFAVGCFFGAILRGTCASPSSPIGVVDGLEAEVVTLRAKAEELERDNAEIIRLRLQIKQLELERVGARSGAEKKEHCGLWLAKIKDSAGKLKKCGVRLSLCEHDLEESRFGHCVHRNATLQPRVHSDVTDCKRTYGDVFSCAREFFTDQSPLPAEDTPAAAKAKFAKIPQLFDFQAAKQLELWKEFVQGSYVSPQHHELLRDNGNPFPDLDRTFLFCFLLRTQPSRMIEIGTGDSSRVAAAAFRTIALSGGRSAEHSVLQPQRPSGVPAGMHVIAERVETIDARAFDQLADGDILFIDSSHVVMPYGDTLTELLTILPRLNALGIVHFHDVFLPDDYKADLGTSSYVYTEQWLVALLLYGADRDWEVVWASHYMSSKHADALLAMPDYPLNHELRQQRPSGSSLWLRKKGPPLRS